MSCQDKVSRIIVKRSFTAGVAPTVPPNEDHRSGLWSDTDIYIGEMFFNVEDGKLYTRSNAGIEEVPTSSSDGNTVYIASLIQSGSDAPVATVIKNTLGDAVVWTRESAGLYRGTLAGAFDGNVMVEVTQAEYLAYVVALRPTGITDYIQIYTDADNILGRAGAGTNYIKVTKF
jgi:hypothetical protein